MPVSTAAPGRIAIPWRWLVAQFFVIFASVMIALAADRWSSKHDDRAKVKEYLEQLRSDFVANEQIAQSGVVVKHSYAASAATALDALHGIRSPDRKLPLPFDIELAGWNHTPAYLSEAWQELLATGDIGLISSTELRNAVSAFYQQVSTVRDYEAEWRTYVMAYRSAAIEVLDPYLRLRILDLYNGAMVEDSLGKRASDSEILARLGRVPGVQGRLADVIMADRAGEFYYRRHVTQIQKILTIIDTELKSRPGRNTATRNSTE